MKIDASNMNLVSSHRASLRTEARETLRAWVGERRPDFDATQSTTSVVALSAAARNAVLAMPDMLPSSAPPAADEAQAIEQAGDSVEHDPVLYLIRLVVEMLSGFRVKTVSATAMQPDAPPPCVPEPAPAAPAQTSQQAAPRADFGIEYERHEVREENEHTSFQGEGVIRTADGKEFHIKITLEMDRSAREESEVSMRAGDGVRKDPLVINFDGAAAQLQGKRFRFDLDGDGRAEDVPLLAGNRGYLALDANHNGKIDSGKELFGTDSGDGFADLAHHDSDGNGWIDENDPVFNELRVWIQDGQGGGTLGSLQEHGVGALYLGRAATPFELRDDANRGLGAMRSSGLYLAEDGSAGTLQQVDLMV